MKCAWDSCPTQLKLYGHRPEILALLVQLNNVVMRDPSGHLDLGLKRRIGAYCSRLNGCTYCTAHNCGTLKTAVDTDAEGWGYSDDDISELLDDNYVPDEAAEKACFDYARAASADSSSVPSDILDALAEHLTPPQVEVITVSSSNTGSTDPDLAETVQLARVNDEIKIEFTTSERLSGLDAGPGLVPKVAVRGGVGELLR